jgi:uncharacterized protein (TIGR03086 family)
MTHTSESPEMGTATALENAVVATEKVVAGVSPDQLGAPTPCSDWDVRALLNHLVATLREFDARFHERELSDDLGAPGGLPAKDLLGDDPLTAYRDAAEALLDSVRPAGALERKYPTPVGELPGSLLAEAAVLDVVVHGWDLARATGQDTGIDPPLAEHALAFAQGFVSDQMRPRVFGSNNPVPDDAPVGDRLVAFVGRNP